MTSTVTVYDAGGGAGRKNLVFESLAEGQSQMYARTLNQLSDFQIESLAQEKRQITVVDIPVTITINIAREDFPNVTARVEITYIPSASQQVWEKFIKDTCKKLKIDFIHSILDRVDRSPVHRILRLRNNGDYLARQRETSAILEVINSGMTPMEVSWDITMDINDVKQSLALDERNQPVIDRRVASLVAKPLTRETQRDITTLLLNAVSPKVAVGIMEQFHRQFNAPASTHTEEETTTDAKKDPAEIDWGDIGKYGDAIDITTLHRLCLETLGRFVTKGRAKNIAASPCFDYVCGVIDGLRQEVDVVAMGLKLLSDVMKYLVEERERTYHVVLNCIQAYAPTAPKHRPRNPKRLRPAEDLYMESMANLGTTSGGMGLTGGSGMGGHTNGAHNSSIGSNIGGHAVGGQGHSTTMAGKVGAVPDMHPSLTRYGDFYGHSPAPQQGAALELSQAINLNKLYEHKNTDTYNRWRVEAVSPRKEAHKEAPVQPATATTAEEVNNGPPDADGVKVFVRGRGRVDHQAASQALQSAFHATPSSATAMTHSASTPTLHSTGAGPTAGSAASTKAGAANGTTAAEDSAEFVKQQREFKEKQKRERKYQFKFKVKGTKEDGAHSEGAETGDEGERKWKGSVGVIGRRAPEKPKEVVIDFKKKIAYDPTKDSGEADTEGAEGADGPSGGPVKTAEEVAQAAADAADNAAVAEALRATSAAAGKRKKKRHHKLTLTPLPLVPCVVFRGLSGKSKQNLAMMQSFATLYKMVSQNYGNREVAFKMGVAEEISVVVTVCQGMPRVLDYYIWTVDALYRDGFGELTADELDIALEDYTMVLSASAPGAAATHKPTTTTAKTATVPAKKTSAGTKGSADERGENTSMTGFVFDTVSEMTVPSIDQDGLLSEATPVVNMGVALPEGPAEAPDLKAGKPRRRTSSVDDPAATNTGTESKVGTDDAMDENPIVPSNQIKKAANQLLINALGLFEFEARYVQRPADDIVIAVAMISMHTELDSRERSMAQRWLDTWDDNSREYKTLRRKGMDLAGM